MVQLIKTAKQADPALDAGRVAANKKGERIAILDVSNHLVITDYFVICSGNSERQVRTIAEEVERGLHATRGLKPFRREGEREARWVILDYVDFVVHVFHKEDREYYDLERLWADAPRLDPIWEEHDEPTAAAEAP